MFFLFDCFTGYILNQSAAYSPIRSSYLIWNSLRTSLRETTMARWTASNCCPSTRLSNVYLLLISKPPVPRYLSIFLYAMAGYHQKLVPITTRPLKKDSNVSIFRTRIPAVGGASSRATAKPVFPAPAFSERQVRGRSLLIQQPFLRFPSSCL